MADYVEGLDQNAPAATDSIAATLQPKLTEIQRCVKNSLSYAQTGRFKGLPFLAQTSDPPAPTDGLVIVSGGYTSSYPVTGGTGNYLAFGLWLWNQGYWFPISNIGSYQVGCTLNTNPPGIISGPSNWSVARLDVGLVRLTHNLNLAEYGIIVTMRQNGDNDIFSPTMAVYRFRAANTVDIFCLRLDGSGAYLQADCEEVSVLLTVNA